MEGETLEPWDEFNQALVQRVHPANWPEPPRRGKPYHLVVLGGGTAGLIAAIGAAGLGARVALVERRLLGGDCLNFGCVPSKAILAAAREFQRTKTAAEFGLLWDSPPTFDLSACMLRMRRLRAGIAVHDSAARLAGLGVDVFFGPAEFSGPRQVRVGDRTLDFWRAVIATGGRPAEPDAPGLADVGYLTNETIFSIVELPRRLAVVGTGPIGCELAQAFRRFGSAVHLIGRGDRLLSKEDEPAVQIVEQRFRQEGIALHLASRVAGAVRQGEATVLTIEERGARRTIEVDAILVALGRRPNIEGLGLHAAGIAIGPEGVQVNDRLQTTNRAVFAAGDVCTKIQFTHAADAMARICVQNALFYGRKLFSRRFVPRCTYTDPAVAHVGATAIELQRRGERFETFRCELSRVDRAVLDGETDGFAAAHANPRSGKALGATIVATHAGELIGEMTSLLERGGKLRELAQVIRPYPTQAEVFKRLGDDSQRKRLTPRVAWLMKRWFR